MLSLRCIVYVSMLTVEKCRTLITPKGEFTLQYLLLADLRSGGP